MIFIAGYCNRPLGLQNRRLKNNQITASSSYPGLPTWRARLHHAQAWCARYNNHNQWIKFDFVSVTKVTGVAVQGRSNAHQWVTRYLLYFSQDNVHWAVYRYKSNDKVRLMPVTFFFFKETVLHLSCLAMQLYSSQGHLHEFDQPHYREITIHSETEAF